MNPGRIGSLVARTIPAGEERIRFRIDRVIQFHQAEIGPRIGRPENRPGIELVQPATRGLIVAIHSRNSTLRALEVPVDHHARRICRCDAAVVGCQEKWTAILRGVVYQSPAACFNSVQGIGTYRTDLVPIGIDHGTDSREIFLTTDNVEVAAVRRRFADLLQRLFQTAKTVVHMGELEFNLVGNFNRCR